MLMRQVAGPCKDGNCPKIIDLEGSEDVVVQGPKTELLGELPGGEVAVRIPRALIEEAARALAGAR